MLPEGHRLHVVLEGITRGFTAVNIRKFLLRAHRLSDLVALGSLTPQAARFLEASVRAGLNVLVAGGTRTGAKRQYGVSAWPDQRTLDRAWLCEAPVEIAGASWSV